MMSMMSMTRCILLLLFFALPLHGQIIGWRTDGTGIYPDATPPIEWGKQNVVWSTPLPGRSHAIPVVLGERIFVCSDPSALMCINTADGSVRWQHELNYANVEMPDGTDSKLPPTHGNNGHSTPTPVTDGVHVWVLSGIGIAACFDLEGNQVWARFIDKPTHEWGHSASPALIDGVLVVAIRQFHGLDARTGKERWSTDSALSWGSPTATRVGDEAILLTAHGAAIRVRDGAKIDAQLGKLEYATPVVQDGIAYYIEGNAVAVKLGPLDGTTLQTEQLWRQKLKGSRHYASPVIHDGLIYAVSDEGKFSITDAATGEVYDQRKLDFVSGGNSVYPSVSFAGGHIFMGCQEGVTVVLEPGKTYKQIARNKTEGYRSTPVFVGNRMYLRTFSHLTCFSSHRARPPA